MDDLEIIFNTRDNVGHINNIRIIGSKKDRETAAKHLQEIEGLLDMTESHARLAIQKVIDDYRLKASILYTGNTVWSRRRIIDNLRRIKKAGVLYDKEKPRLIPIGSLLRMPTVGETILSDYFYKFLSLCCGSIAHYNIQGWVAEYPTVEDLKQFFLKNEHGHRVIDDIPYWKTDAKEIVMDIERELGIRNDMLSRYVAATQHC